MKQQYNKYTSRDLEVWQTLFTRQVNNLNQKASCFYFDALEKIGFTANRIPHFEEVNALLKSTTGWELEVVPNIVPEMAFFNLLAKQKFPATTWLRSLKQLDYLEEPDMFHDVFGHVPLLTNTVYVHFFKGLANLALAYKNNVHVIQALGRVYWFTVEFGLIQENNAIRIYGAGIISSFGETNHCLSKNVKHHAFNVAEIMHKPFTNSEIQNEYYILKSFDDLNNSLAEIETICAEISTSTLAL